MMAATTIEQQKILYSRQVVAHTLRQWNLLQERADEKKRSVLPTSDTQTRENNGGSVPANASENGIETGDHQSSDSV